MCVSLLKLASAELVRRQPDANGGGDRERFLLILGRERASRGFDRRAGMPDRDSTRIESPFQSAKIRKGFAKTVRVSWTGAGARTGGEMHTLSTVGNYIVVA